MKKLIEKDKKFRQTIKRINKKHFVLKSIFKNFNFSTLIRWKAFLKLKMLNEKSFKVALSKKCLLTLNKKNYSKLTFFSRYVFLKQIRTGFVSNSIKTSW